MTGPTADAPSRAELRRQQANERRKLHASQVIGQPLAEGTAVQLHLSPQAQALQRAFPRELLERGAIVFDQQGQPRVAAYDPALLAPNPQRGRVVDRNLEELAASLDTHGQQEPLAARLITDTDRERWPDAFAPGQVLLILQGHRVYYAQPRSKLRMLQVELMLPVEGEGDLAYSRRGLRRAAIKMMHSQGYDIFDKVNQYAIWRQEFELEKPKDAEVAAYFEISRTEAQRVKVVSGLDPSVAREILNSDRRPADEVVFHIASRPAEEHEKAYRRYGHLPVATVRRLLQAENGDRPAAGSTAAGRPRNYVLAVRGEGCAITYVGTALTPQQWKEQGGAKAFWDAVRALVNDREIQERLQADLG